MAATTTTDKLTSTDSRDDNEQLIDSIIEQHSAQRAASAALPPARQNRKTADEVLEDMRKVPLFMNSMDDIADADDVPELEALRLLAYEGTRAEVAENFKTQGNELVATKNWSDAKEFYGKAIAALNGPQQYPEGEDEGTLDEEVEEGKERVLSEACYANRALCHLELKNYGSCVHDCAAVLRINPNNIKAYYRAGTACLALDKIAEAVDAAENGLVVDSSNEPLKILLAKIQRRKETLDELERVRVNREETARRKTLVLKQALAQRKIKNTKSSNPPNMEDAELVLEDPESASSTLSMPLLLLYPLEAQTDFIKAVAEHDNLQAHLEYILPPPWDESNQGQYASPDGVECYMETNSGGLIKIGKKLSLLKVLSSGKVDLVDGIVKVNVVPKDKTTTFIEEFKKRRGG